MRRVVIAGGHGKIALRLERLLAERGDQPLALIRNPDHRDDVRDSGAQPVVVDLEHTTAEDLTEQLRGADATVFAAGAGPGSGAARKDTVDRGAAALLAEATERAGVRRHLQVGSMGVNSPERPGADPVFVAYLIAKKAAEDDLRNRDLDWTILRPGRLTDQPGTGRVHLDLPPVDYGEVSRDDVAAVLLALLDEPLTARRTIELVSGDVPIVDAVRSVAAK